MSKKTLYCRVSTKEQEFESQKQIVEDYINRADLGFTIDDLEVVEEKLSGDTDMSMRALQDLIDRSKEGDTIYVAMLTRFSRSAITGMYALWELYQKGVKIIDCSKGWEIDLSDHSKKMIYFVDLWAAEQELCRIRTASKAGTKKAKKDGVLYGRANPKYNEDPEKRKQAVLNTKKTKVFKRLNDPQLKVLIQAIEIIIPEIKEYVLDSLDNASNQAKYAFLGYGRFRRFTDEEWESIQRTYEALASSNPIIDKDASINDLKYVYHYLWQGRFKQNANLFIEY